MYVCVCLSSLILLISAIDVPEFEYSSTLLGILVMQDVQLGLLVAMLPALAGVDTAAIVSKVGEKNAADAVTDLFSTVAVLTKVLVGK